MKKLICDMAVILAGLGFVMVLGAIAEGTLALPVALLALGLLAAAMGWLSRLGTAARPPRHLARKAAPARLRVAHAAQKDQNGLRVA